MSRRRQKNNKANLRAMIKWQKIQRWLISTASIQVKQRHKKLKVTKLDKESNQEKTESNKFRTIKTRSIQRKTRTSPSLKERTQVQRTTGNRPLLKRYLQTRQKTRFPTTSRTTPEANRTSRTRAIRHLQGKSTHYH